MNNFLTRKQPDTLYHLISMANQTLGGTLPTGSDLAEKLKTSVRNASDRKRRLVEAHPELFVIKNNKNIKVNEKAVCTFKKTALFLLELEAIINKESEFNPDGTISGTVAETLFLNIYYKENKRFYNSKLKLLLNAGYLKMVGKNELQLADKYAFHKSYLQLLAGKRKT